MLKWAVPFVCFIIGVRLKCLENSEKCLENLENRKLWRIRRLYYDKNTISAIFALRAFKRAQNEQLKTTISRVIWLQP